MSYRVVNLPKIIAAGTSAGANTNAIGGIDDAESITIYFVSTAAASSTGAIMYMQVSQYDPALGSTESGVTQSTGWNNLSSLTFSTGTGLVTSSGCAITLSNISFRGFRLTGFSSATTSETIAYASKQIVV